MCVGSMLFWLACMQRITMCVFSFVLFVFILSLTVINFWTVYISLTWWRSFMFISDSFNWNGKLKMKSRIHSHRLMRTKGNGYFIVQKNAITNSYGFFSFSRVVCTVKFTFAATMKASIRRIKYKVLDDYTCCCSFRLQMSNYSFNWLLNAIQTINTILCDDCNKDRWDTKECKFSWTDFCM